MGSAAPFTPLLPPPPSCSHLFHDGILWVFALHDARLDEVPNAVVASPSCQDGEVGRLLGVLDPLLYPCKRLRKGNNAVWVRGLKGGLGIPCQGYAALSASPAQEQERELEIRSQAL